MRIFPKDKQEWLPLLLFPFKVYLITAIGCFFVWDAITQKHQIRGATAQAVAPVVVGYILCVLVFLLAALVQFVIRHREAAIKNFWYALIGIVIVIYLLPMCATA